MHSFQNFSIWPSCLEFGVVKEIPLYKLFDLSLAFSRLWNGLLGYIGPYFIVLKIDSE